MTESPDPKNDLADEFRNLGQNLTEVLRAAWDSPERKRLQQEIGDGLSELVSTLKREADNFEESPTGQRLKSDVQNLQQRVRSGEAEAQVREQLLNVLRTVNTELQKTASQRRVSDSSPGAGEPPPESGQEV